MFDSLHRRPRGRRAARVLSAVTGGRVPGGPSWSELRVLADGRAAELRRQAAELEAHDALPAVLAGWDPAAHDVPGYARELGSASRALLDRIDTADVTELERRIVGPDATAWAPGAWVDRGYLTLTLGVHYGVPAIIEKTGLSPAMPPEDVHAMARGSLAAGGDPYLADLVLGALERAGRPLEPGASALDFGCSSGRVVRVLAAARRDVEWLGCDPNAGAIAWAIDHLNGVRWFVSPQMPPLELPDASLDAVYAISIWSHFDADAALAWIEEMQRVLRPGGRLVLTTHGLGSIGPQVVAGSMLPEVAATCGAALYRSGFWFSEAFGEAGDHGVRSARWGMAYFTPEWLLPRVQEAWALLLYEPARLDRNQDVYVLERR